MSQEQTAFLKKSDVPDKAKLELAAKALGFDLQVDDSYEPFVSCGYVPCRLKGKNTGFEIYFGLSEETFETFPHLKVVVGDRDCAISFRWGGDMLECACVLVVSAALAQSFEAVIHYEDDDLLYTADQLVTEAKEALQYAK